MRPVSCPTWKGTPWFTQASGLSSALCVTGALQENWLCSITCAHTQVNGHTSATYAPKALPWGPRWWLTCELTRVSGHIDVLFARTHLDREATSNDTCFYINRTDRFNADCAVQAFFVKANLTAYSRVMWQCWVMSGSIKSTCGSSIDSAASVLLPEHCYACRRFVTFSASLQFFHWPLKCAMCSCSMKNSCRLLVLMSNHTSALWDVQTLCSSSVAVHYNDTGMKGLKLGLCTCVLHAF